MAYKPKHFKPEELVGQRIYDSYSNKDDVYSLFNDNLLKIADLTRQWTGRPIVINNWKAGGSRKESGLRDPNTSTGASKSAHKTGEALDMLVSGMTPQQVWKIIDQHADELPCKIRIEKTSNGKTITWVHIDVKSKPDQKEKVYYFNA